MTDLEQAQLVKWSSAGAGALAGGYAGYKIAAKFTKGKPVIGAAIGAVVLGGIVFAAVHYGTKTAIVAPPADGNTTPPATNPTTSPETAQRGTTQQTAVINGVTYNVPAAGQKPTYVGNGWLCGNGLIYKTNSCQGSPVPSFQN